MDFTLRCEMNFRKFIADVLLHEPKKAEMIRAPRQRSFRAALNSRFIQWLIPSGNNINIDLISQLKILIQRSRNLAQNNQLFRSYLENCQKGIVGAEGFTLNMQITNPDGTLNEELNDEIEWAWYQFTRKGIELSDKYDDISLDAQILRAILVDGECFIQIIRDTKSPFGVRFKLIDSLSVDTNFIQVMTETQNGIFNGVEVDQNYKVVRYWLRTGYTGNYESGKLYAVPAEDMIHLYRPQFINQVRGFSPAVASFDSLKQLDDFAVAELIAAKISSCQGIFYQRNGQTPTGDFLKQEENDDGVFLTELSPGTASVVPNGYSVKTLTPNHPSSQYGEFVKAMGKRVASSMGTNYNTLFGDLQSVNYSSLRQANIAQNSFYKSWQKFLIDNWKNVEFELFLRSYIINKASSKLKPSEYKKYLRSYQFIGKTDPSYDISKQILAIERSLKLGISSPIIEIEKRGLDPQEVAKSWVKWKQLCENNNLNFDYQTNQAPNDSVQQFNEQADNGDQNK